MGAQNYAHIPATNQPGLILESKGDGTGNGLWVTASIVPDSGNYVLQGTLVTGAIQAFTKRVLSGSQVTLTSIVAWIGSGTSATFTAYQNGSALSWATGASATTTSESTPLTPSSPVAVADLDEFYFNITAVSGAPSGMTVCFVFEVSGAIGSGGAQGPAGPAGTNGTNGVGYSGVTSTTSITIGTGSKTWTMSNTGAFAIGDRVRVINSATEYEEGVITALTANTSITVNVDLTLGSGTYTSWTFSLAGNPGVVQSLTAGTGVTITGTTANPIVNASGGGGSAGYLALTEYAPVSDPAYTINTSAMTALDTTNLTTASFTVPASGKIKVTVTGGYIHGNNNVMMALLNHTGGAVEGIAQLVGVFSVTAYLPVCMVFVVTGLTPSASLQLDLAMQTASGSTCTYHIQNNTSPAVGTSPGVILVEGM